MLYPDLFLLHIKLKVAGTIGNDTVMSPGINTAYCEFYKEPHADLKFAIHRKCSLLVPPDIDSQPAPNCFPISKSCAQNFTFIINETDLCEGSGLERHAKTLTLTLC